MSLRITSINNTIFTIRKQIPTQQCPACAEVTGVIRIQESTDRRIIIPALEVVEPGFTVVDVATVGQRVAVEQSCIAGVERWPGKLSAPGIVGVGHGHAVPGQIIQAHHIALKIQNVPIGSAALVVPVCILHVQRFAFMVIIEPCRACAANHGRKLSVFIPCIGIGSGAVGLSYP